MTDRPQFDVLASMRPAPERRPSEVEKMREELAEIAKAVQELMARVADLEPQVDALMAMVQP